MIKSKKLKVKNQSGISLLEILVVISIFAILGVITTRAVILTLQGSKKTESTVLVRENLNFAMGVAERNIRNANKITTCPNSDPNILNFLDSNGNPTTFSCVNIGTTNGYVASGSGRLTSTLINITSCSFVCATNGLTNPPAISISFKGVDKNTSGIEGAEVTVTNTINLRNY
jgi:prepilin-type N-terminal cleavage/methylation domain-containing protein